MELRSISPLSLCTDATPDAHAWALIKDGIPVGHCLIQPQGRVDELLCFCVDEGWRGRGYGTYFIKQVLRHTGPCVEVLVSEQNPRLLNFFARFGFSGWEHPQPGLRRLLRSLEPQINALSIAHDFLRHRVRPGSFVIDATAGRGRDTAFLCSLAGPSGRVLAVDIQPEAVSATNALLAQKGYASFAKAVLASHAHLNDFAETSTVDAIMFNLGYLPGGDHQIFTRSQISLPAIDMALELLKPGGCMTVCIYHGGPQGEEEKDALLPFLTGLDPRRYTVMVTEFPNRTGPWPIPVCIVKHRFSEKGAT